MLVSTRGWGPFPMLFAKSFRARWRGMAAAGDNQAVLLRTCCVHTRGLSTPIWVIVVDDWGAVESVEELAVGGMRSLAERGWVLELRRTCLPPRPGDQLVVSRRRSAKGWYRRPY